MNFKILIPAFLLAISCSVPNEKADDKKEIKIENVKLDVEKDPVCEMSVKDHFSDTAIYQGKIYGFCNVGCKEEFKKNPERYIKK